MNEINQAIQKMTRRAFALNGVMLDREGNKVDMETAIAASLKAILEDKSPNAAKAAVIQAAWNDPAKMRQLCELRVEQVNNYIWASSNIAALFFRVQTLSKPDRPVVQNETKNQIKIGYIAQDGGPKSVKLENPQEETLIPLKYLWSDSYGYFLTDIYNGDISASALKTINISFDLQRKIDSLAFTLLTASLGSGGAFGTFTTTGTKVKRVYVPHGDIDTSNLPTTNDVVLSDNTSSTNLRMDVLRKAIRYCDQWANAFADGALRPTGKVLVPSSDADGILNEITPTGSTNNPIADAAMNSYTSFSYAGVNWMLVPDNTLAPKTCYVQLNKPVGTIFAKPDLDEEYVETDRKKNWEERSQRKVVGFYITEPDRVRALRIKYRT